MEALLSGSFKLLIPTCIDVSANGPEEQSYLLLFIAAGTPNGAQPLGE